MKIYTCSNCEKSTDTLFSGLCVECDGDKKDGSFTLVNDIYVYFESHREITKSQIHEIDRANLGNH
jgi:hypothetical protein